MKNFKVMADGIPTPVSDASWQSEELKQKLDSNKEVFIGVAWKRSVTDVDDGYWEKRDDNRPAGCLHAQRQNDISESQRAISDIQKTDCNEKSCGGACLRIRGGCCCVIRDTSTELDFFVKV